MGSGDLYMATWMTLNGFGLGLVMVASMSAAISALSGDRAGVGSAAVQAIQKVSMPLSIAVLGSVLNSTYQGHLQLAGLSPDTADVVRGGLFAGMSVAERIGSPALLDSVRSSFMAGMDTALLLAAVVTTVGAILALAFLPGRVLEGAEDQTLSTETFRGGREPA